MPWSPGKGSGRSDFLYFEPTARVYSGNCERLLAKNLRTVPKRKKFIHASNGHMNQMASLGLKASSFNRQFLCNKGLRKRREHIDNFTSIRSSH